MKNTLPDFGPEVNYSLIVKELIPYIKENTGLTQKQIAEATGIHFATISRAKVGSELLTNTTVLHTIKRVCQHFDIKIEYTEGKINFTGGKNYPPKSNLDLENNSHTSTKREVVLLISENKVNEATNKLKNAFIRSSNEDALDEIVLIMSNLAEFEKLERLGLVEIDSILLFKSRINSSILKICKTHLPG